MREMRDERAFTDQKKPGMGCVAKGCIAAAVCAVVLAVVGAFTGYYLFFHSAMPARALVGILNQDPNIQIEGITGSLSSGFEVETMRFKDDDGNTNALDDVRLKYKKDAETIVITEAHVGRGYFYVDRSKDKVTVTDEDGNTVGGDATVDETTSTTADSDSSDLDIMIEKISINDMTVEDVSTGEKFKLDGIQLDSLHLGNDFSMGKLIVKCTTCDLSIIPSDGAEVGKVFTVKALLKPGLHDKIIAPIDVKGSIDASDKHNTKLDIVAFGEKLKIKGGEKDVAIQISELNLADYLTDAPPLKKISLRLSQKDDVGKAKGSFMVGSNRFIIDQTVKIVEDEEMSEELIATCRFGSVSYEIRFVSGDLGEKFFPEMTLSTKPKMPVKDALSQLLTGKTHGSLTDTDKTKVDNALAYFAPQKKAATNASK